MGRIDCKTRPKLDCFPELKIRINTFFCFGIFLYHLLGDQSFEIPVGSWITVLESYGCVIIFTAGAF